MKLKLLSESEAAERLRIAPLALARLRRSAETKPPVPFLNLASNIFYEESEIIKWAKQQRSPVKRGRPKAKKRGRPSTKNNKLKIKSKKLNSDCN